MSQQSNPATLRDLAEQLCDCDGRRLNGRARELANEIREALAASGTEAAPNCEAPLREVLDGWIEAHRRLDHTGITDCTRCKRIAEIQSGFALASQPAQAAASPEGEGREALWAKLEERARQECPKGSHEDHECETCEHCHYYVDTAWIGVEAALATRVNTMNFEEWWHKVG